MTTKTRPAASPALAAKVEPLLAKCNDQLAHVVRSVLAGTWGPYITSDGFVMGGGALMGEAKTLDDAVGRILRDAKLTQAERDEFDVLSQACIDERKPERKWLLPTTHKQVGTVAIATKDGPKTVQAFRKSKVFAITATPIPGYFNLTHVPTGLAVQGNVPTWARVNALFDGLAALPIDWASKRGQADFTPEDLLQIKMVATAKAGA